MLVHYADTMLLRKYQIVLVIGDGKWSQWFKIRWRETDLQSESRNNFQCILIQDNKQEQNPIELIWALEEDFNFNFNVSDVMKIAKEKLSSLSKEEMGSPMHAHEEN